MWQCRIQYRFSSFVMCQFLSGSIQRQPKIHSSTCGHNFSTVPNSSLSFTVTRWSTYVNDSEPTTASTQQDLQMVASTP